MDAALPYTQYGFFLRWLMKHIASVAGAPVDTTRDHDLTDWDEVARFADGIAADLAERAAPAAPPSSGDSAAARSGVSRPPRMLSSVDLPLPDGPSITMSSPAPTSRSMPRSACTSTSPIS